MNKRRHIGIYFLGLSLIVGTIVFVYNDFICNKDSCYELEVSVFEPLVFTILGLLPTLIFLLFFSDRIFLSWAKRIAWWFVLVVAILVRINDHENDFSPFANDATVIGMMMTILFIITLVYALVMNRRLKTSERNNS